MLTEFAFLKPWMAALILPPGSPLLLMLIGYLLAVRSERIVWMAVGKMLFVISFAALWIFSTQGAAIYLERVALRPPQPLDPQLVIPTFQAEQIQAIVVLGGGVQSVSKEYGRAALSDSSAQRLHYATTLSRQTGLPLAFSGGRGWAAPAVSDQNPLPPINSAANLAANQTALSSATPSTPSALPSALASSGKTNAKASANKAAVRPTAEPLATTLLASGDAPAPGSEAAAAQRWLAQLGLAPVRWVDDQSRDTAGNAQAIAALLQKQGIERIALVTHASHMPRALLAFQNTPLKTLPAPTYFLQSEQGMGLDWFPSGRGLRNTRLVLHELAGMAGQKR